MDVTYGSTGRQARFRVDAPRSEPAVYEFEKNFDGFDPGEFQVGIVNGTRFRLGNQEWYHFGGVMTRLAESGQAKEASPQHQIAGQIKGLLGLSHGCDAKFLFPVVLGQMA